MKRNGCLLAFVLAVALALAWACGPARSHPTVAEASSTSCQPFSDEDLAALRWLEHVTGPLSAAEEKEWWNVGGGQFGIFSKRYNIAFCGYAAAAFGIRGDADCRRRVAQILGRCIERYLRLDVWAYAMAKSYWGRCPWAPDPCYRENVMYTGHLLQLLALYEAFSGDRRYWKEGFDFKWKDGRSVHYDIQRLIDVTVSQMRSHPGGGVCCEPGLMFFPCNNHPHVALKLFARLGHGDWTADALRWERWALDHYVDPLFGGGALNLMHHVRSGLFWPRGINGLDGWSLLWYEPWAEDRGTALAIWRKAADRIDWKALEGGPDKCSGDGSCCSPVDVPAIATATFLAAAARACDDPDTAARLEGIAARNLVRRDGMVYLDVGREWRIGATANYFISRAIAGGTSFRRFLQRGGGDFTVASSAVDQVHLCFSPITERNSEGW